MNWTVERFLNEWDVLLAPVPWLLEGLESPARHQVASYAIAAFELRTQVSRCKAWRHKDPSQIEEDFMNKVIVPLVRMHPRPGSEGDLLPWNDDYKDRRGPKTSEPKEELEIVLSYLKKCIPRLSTELDTYQNAGIDEPIDEIKKSLIAHKIVMRDAMNEWHQKYASRLESVIDINKAKKHLTSVGIPCEKAEIDVFWINLVATIWGVEKHCIYSVARKLKKLRRQ